MPSDGFVLANGDDPNLSALPQPSWTTVLRVGLGPDNDLRIVDFSEGPSGVVFRLLWREIEVGEVKWNMPGEYNARNAAMAALASALAQAAAEGREPDLAGNPLPRLVFHLSRNAKELNGVRKFSSTGTISWSCPISLTIPRLFPVPSAPYELVGPSTV